MPLTAEQRLDVLAPQFASHAAKSSFLAMADEQTAPASRCMWTAERRAQAVALRAAHMLTLSLNPLFKDGSASGPVSSKSEGDLSVSFGSAPGSSANADLSQTTYGRQLIELGASSFIAIGVTGGDFLCG